MDQAETQALATKALDGDESAWDALYAHHAEPLVQGLRDAGHDDAAGLARRVWEELFRRRDSLLTTPLLTRSDDLIAICLSLAGDEADAASRGGGTAASRKPERGKILVTLRNLPRTRRPLHDAKGQARVQRPRGLHGRPWRLIVETAGRFQSQVSFTIHGKKVDGKAIMEVISVHPLVDQYTLVDITAHGSDAEEAVTALSNAFQEATWTVADKRDARPFPFERVSEIARGYEARVLLKFHDLVFDAKTGETTPVPSGMAHPPKEVEIWAQGDDAGDAVLRIRDALSGSEGGP